jgi:hypothetical protein
LHLNLVIETILALYFMEQNCTNLWQGADDTKSGEFFAVAASFALQRLIPVWSLFHHFVCSFIIVKQW